MDPEGGAKAIENLTAAGNTQSRLYTVKHAGHHRKSPYLSLTLRFPELIPLRKQFIWITRELLTGYWSRSWTGDRGNRAPIPTHAALPPLSPPPSYDTPFMDGTMIINYIDTPLAYIEPSYPPPTRIIRVLLLTPGNLKPSSGRIHACMSIQCLTL